MFINGICYLFTLWLLGLMIKYKVDTSTENSVQGNIIYTHEVFLYSHPYNVCLRLILLKLNNRTMSFLDAINSSHILTKYFHAIEVHRKKAFVKSKCRK
jgi:hypothetical protein